MISASTASRLISPRPRKAPAPTPPPAEEEEERREAKGEELRFVCQRCRKPVLLGDSFADVDDAALDAALAAPPAPTAPAGGAAGAGGSAGAGAAGGAAGAGGAGAAAGGGGGGGGGAAPPGGAEGAGAGGARTLDERQFVLLQQRPRAGARAGGGGRAAALRRLFQQAGAAGRLLPADHPLCAECAALLLAELARRTQEEAQEAARYEAFLAGLAQERQEAGREEARLLEETAALEADAAALEALLARLEQQRLQVHEGGARLQLQARASDLLEERYWRTCNRFQLQLEQYEEEKAAVVRQTRYAQEQLQALQRTNVYNDTFHIWHDGHFATVNGLRLGSLPSMQVEWPEINAAWGHAALLLHTLACKVGFRFSAFRVLPLGSQSRMERLSDRATFELYGSREITFGKLFWFKRFDTAMVAFLQCVEELCQHLRHLDAAFQQPYRCERDRLGPDHAHMLSVKKQFNSDEEWTKAMKYLLTNLKAVLQWLSNR